jgi:hypothetical protein
LILTVPSIAKEFPKARVRLVVQHSAQHII